MEITVTALEKCDIIVIDGRIDSYTAPDLSDTLTNFTKQGRCQLILDMSGVNYVSSAGLRVLIDTQKTCKKTPDGELILVNIPDRIYETLELAGFAPLFRFYSNVESALAAF